MKKYYDKLRFVEKIQLKLEKTENICSVWK